MRLKLNYAKALAWLIVLIGCSGACESQRLATNRDGKFQPKQQSLRMMEESIYRPDDPKPHPDLLPEDVVRIQLRALKHNDSSNHGIAVTYRFASPDNKLYTGPLPRFIQMLHNPLYAPMLNYETEEIGEIKKKGNYAEQKVVLIDKTGRAYTYLFMLSKQEEGDYKGCWMTDGVRNLTAERQSEATRTDAHTGAKETNAGFAFRTAKKR
ncbi:MAG: DUF4864 domain-containing protein [Chloroherpetonaceae bacterium]|nr:DUF4864 domain-containing protein [Chloroherpetonaceae bacterium]